MGHVKRFDETWTELAKVVRSRSTPPSKGRHGAYLLTSDDERSQTSCTGQSVSPAGLNEWRVSETGRLSLDV